MEFDAIYQGLITGEEKLALVGLGYVGMPLAVEFAKHVPVIGFDINEKRVNEYANGIDATNEVGEGLKTTTVEFTSDASRLKDAKFLIVAVPTPVNSDNTPDLRPIEGASRTVGQNLTPGSIVVFESTVYPGVTEDICIPIIEKESGLKCGEDWKIGYSPERINPGDCVHTLTNIQKIVSGMDEESAREIQKVYNIVIKAGTFPVSTIKTAEAVKVIENSQRDINIAFMNEVAMICDRMGIDTDEVLTGPGLPPRTGGRPLHRRGPLLPHQRRRSAGLSQPDHSEWPQGQRQHGRIRGGRRHPADDRGWQGAEEGHGGGSRHHL